jgi:hypothetical protein
MVDIFGRMETIIKVNIRMISKMEKENIFIIMESIMRVIIRMAKEMGMVLYLIEMEVY